MASNAPDGQFFADHPDRSAHIRLPVKILEIDKQRATRYVDECHREFETLGFHDKGRRRILLWKVPEDNQFYDPRRPQILKIPFLAFSDETIEDTDAILLPILHGIMTEAKG